jgi:hypothetical protein
MNCDGSYKQACSLHWPVWPDPAQVAATWADPTEATEFGACAVAIALINKLTSKVVTRRSFIGTRFDYWLADPGQAGPLFQGQSKLEVSGIRKGSTNDVDIRTKQKLAQVNKSPINDVEALVAVVEFGAPVSRVVRL